MLGGERGKPDGEGELEYTVRGIDAVTQPKDISVLPIPSTHVNIQGLRRGTHKKGEGVVEPATFAMGIIRGVGGRPQWCQQIQPVCCRSTQELRDVSEHQQKQLSLRRHNACVCTSRLQSMRPLRPGRPGVLWVSCLASGAF